MTARTTNELTEHGLAYLFHALELAADIEMDHRLGVFGEARDMNGMHANVGMLLRDRFGQRERVTRKAPKKSTPTAITN